MDKPALLVLADGSIFEGIAIGARGQSVGEVVFNTSMTGYQEILTDPSYASQIVTLTYPHIGNVGVNPDDMESNRAWAAGLVIRDLSPIVSNWRAQQSLDDFLKQQSIVGISQIDTRRLTCILREKGAQNGCIQTDHLDAKVALAAAQKFPSMQGLDLAKVVSTTKNYVWKDKTWQRSLDVADAVEEVSNLDFQASKAQGAGDDRAIARKLKSEASSARDFKVVAYDFGTKYNIFRILADKGCEVIVVPAETTAEEALALKPDGIFLSNGPGDPAACDYAIKAIAKFLQQRIPIFGICLGHQLLALASGAKTVKMKFGHHGANHPVKDLKTGRVLITSQNHGFAVDEASLPPYLNPTHVSLFDGSLQGIERSDTPAFAFQGHPEDSPGPHDVRALFDDFIEMMRKHAKKN